MAGDPGALRAPHEKARALWAEWVREGQSLRGKMPDKEDKATALMSQERANVSGQSPVQTRCCLRR